MKELSFEDKLIEMNNHGLQLLSLWDKNNNLFDSLPEADQNLIWAVGEGHVAEFYLKRIECRCSLRDSMNFDIGQAEVEIDNRISELKRIKFLLNDGI